MLLDQGLDHQVQVASQDFVQLVQGEVDAVVRDPPLGKVVGADTLGAIAAAHLETAALGLFILAGLLDLGQEAGLEQGQGLGPVLVLGALLLAFHHDAAGQVGDADGRVGLVDVLTAGAGGAECVDAEVGGVDLHLFDLFGLGQYRHGAGGGVDAALGLGFRHPLHPVHPGFELEARIGAPADDAQDDLPVAAVFPLAGTDHLGLPALAGGVLGVHAQQVASEQGSLIATGAGPDLQEDVGLIAGVAGQQQQTQLLFQIGQPVPGRPGFLLGQFADLGVLVLEHVLC